MLPLIKRNLQPTHSATCVKELPNRGYIQAPDETSSQRWP